jgi:hypothetical protein
MYFAALVFLCLLQGATVITALAGRDIAHVIIVRMGLNAQAAKDMNGLIAPTPQVLATLTVTGVAWCVFGFLAIAAALQEWYERIYHQPPATGALKLPAYRVVWTVSAIVATWGVILIGKEVSPAAGPVLSYALQFVVAVVFWCWSAYLLMFGRLRWRQTLPVGVATGFCITGLAVFSALFFSSSIVSGENSYGPIGVVTVLLSYIIGFGVCVHMGALFGQMWNERHAAEPAPSLAEREATHEPAG